jgi:N-acetylglucosaminyldiphosphoundecaprenol N-acetyl-beta-D-mannosaminyltransferase
MSQPTKRPETFDIGGVNVSAITLDGASDFVAGAVATGERTYICIRDAHGIVRCRRDHALRDIHNAAGLVTPDGMPVVWTLKKLGAAEVTRVYGPDLMLRVCDRGRDTGIKHFFYGGAPGVADELAAVLSARFPGLTVAGTHCPPFRDLTDAEIDAVCAEIDATGADIVWVGLSTPKQEYWMARVRDRLKAPVLIGVGAAFDFHSGRKKQAPLWMQRNGLEWLFRAATEPRRLGPRYFRIVPAFACIALRQILFGKGRRAS